MIIIKHRVNTLKELSETPASCGVEVDVRPWGRGLIMHHDPFVQGEDFEDLVRRYSHSMLLVNVKSEGIEAEVIDLLQRYGIRDYFLLDLSFPMVMKYVGKGFTKLALRFSEYESAETCLNLAGRAEWVFIDNFTRLPFDDARFGRIRDKFRLCIVSPELLRREAELEEAKRSAVRLGVDSVLTDCIPRWSN